MSAGRVGMLELTPFLSTELAGTPHRAGRWFWGCYPPVHSLRESRAWMEWLGAYVSTLPFGNPHVEHPSSFGGGPAPADPPAESVVPSSYFRCWAFRRGRTSSISQSSGTWPRPPVKAILLPSGDHPAARCEERAPSRLHAYACPQILEAVRFRDGLFCRLTVVALGCRPAIVTDGPSSPDSRSRS
jgi:hypothetical protein